MVQLLVPLISNALKRLALCLSFACMHHGFFFPASCVCVVRAFSLHMDGIALPSFLGRACSYHPAITGVPTRSLRLPDNLDDLSSPQPQKLGHGILDPDARQLRLLQSVPLEQGLLLLRAQQDVFGDQLVLSDVDQQILLLEDLDVDGQVESLLQRGSRHGRARDVHAAVVVAVEEPLGVGAQLLDADGGFGAEFDEDGADCWGAGDGVRFCGEGGVFGHHGC